MERCIAHARENGLRKLALEVTKENGAVRLYAGLGFVETEQSGNVQTMTMEL
jgi:ribosomal protein S18 acetylase RimI-like enzyme